MTLKVSFNGKQAGPKFKAAATKNKSLLARSITAAARDVAEYILVKGRANMRAAGDFDSARWQLGLHADVTPKFGAITNPRIVVYHDVKYFNIFEYGGIIRGKPMLWIPLSYTGLTMRAREYGRRYGLFRVDRKKDGLPLLISIRDGKPKYFGKKQVRMPRKFRIRTVAAEGARLMPKYYTRNLARLSKGA